jgi:hypothetical protein
VIRYEDGSVGCYFFAVCEVGLSVRILLVDYATIGLRQLSFMFVWDMFECFFCDLFQVV